MTKKKTFEAAMTNLENIVKELESGELSLEKAIKKFEEGVKYSTYCNNLLDKTEKKVSILLEDSESNLKEVPFENE